MTLSAGIQTAAADEAALWQALRSPGHFAIMRHALAPGGGDPDNFQLRDCATQRNLSDDGRDQAKRIGARLRANGVATAKVYSSQWCRCLETARLLGFGEITELPPAELLLPVDGPAGRPDGHFTELDQGPAAHTPRVLVTHQVNITA